MSNGKKHKRQQVTKAPVKGKQKNTLKREPLVVALQLRFIDCEAIIRPFPKNFEVEVVFGNNAKTEIRKIDNDEGKLIFPLLRDDANRFKFLRLHFNSGTNNYILCEKRGDPKTQIVCDKGKADEKAKAGQRFFRLPAKWSLLTSEWGVKADEKIYNKATKEKKFLLTEDDKPRSVGTREKPVEMLLNPHWQYLKFEFFDRYYGHSDHNNKPISIPPVTVEGFYKAKTGEARPDVRSNWTMLQDNDEKKALQCLPWILQAKEDGTAEPKPDKDSSLQFLQPKDSFIFSKSTTERVIRPMTRPLTNAEDVANFKPCANRLKYYDLPETWKSQKYWCRLSDDKAEQGFFEKMADKKTMMQKPLIFSLDDIVLTDKDINPLSLRDTDRVVVFYHEFLDAASDPNKRGDGGRTGATYWKNGLYKPGPDVAEAKKKASDEAKAAEKAKLEKEAREAAIAAETKKEEDDARKAAEEYAQNYGLGYEQIYEEGLQAVAKVSTDAAAQQRIKNAGDTAVANVANDAVAQGKINTAGTNAATLADAPLQAKLKAAAKQRAIEEKNARESALATQLKKEEDDARKAAEEYAQNYGLGYEQIYEEGLQAVAKVSTDAAAQQRIKDAGNAAVVNLVNDVNAQDRITKAGKAAEDAAIAFPYSDVLRHEEAPNYISDYPHWSRLVIANGNLFDVFDKRTTSGDVIGARAAVRWVDATASGIGVAAGTELSPRPGFTPVKAEQDEAFFILQPYFEQKFFVRSKSGQANANRPKGVYDEWNSPIAEGDGKVAKNSRTDMVLLRTSNYKDTNEENVIFRFHRLSFEFTAENNDLNPTGPQPADIEDRRIKWLTNFLKAAGDRWNGHDNFNDSRAWIVEDKSTDPKLRAQVVSFFQRLDKPNAQFHIKTISEKAPDGSQQHSAMEPSKGTGKFRIKAGYSNHSGDFSGAHEMGHTGGQPDDYAPSVKGQTGFGSNHTPGAPFILDKDAMMKKNKQVRARSFWHITEWMRQLNPFTNTKFQIEHSGYTYKIPHYNHADRPGRNYTHWPVKAKIFHAPADPIYFDSYLYFLGQDEYTRVVLPTQPDGMMVVVIKLLFDFKGYTNKKEVIEHIFSKLNQKINTALNKTRVHAQFSLPGVNRSGTNTFEKCMLHFSPRFETTAGLPAHLKITIKTPPDPPAATVLPTAPASGNNYYYDDGSGVGNGPHDLAGLYAEISNGNIMPDTQVHDGSGWDEANNYADLKTLFDVYYWYDDGGNADGPHTLRELYDITKAETIDWETDVIGPGWDPPQHADKIADILPALKRWFYDTGGGGDGPFTEIQMHGKFNTVPIDDDTEVTGEPTDDVWGPAKNWDELEAEFTEDTEPRKLNFRFPINPGNLGGLDPVVKHLENVVLKNVCQLLGLSVKSTDANYYGNADAYKAIVKACVNDNTLNPTMSRP